MRNSSQLENVFDWQLSPCNNRILCVDKANMILIVLFLHIWVLSPTSSFGMWGKRAPACCFFSRANKPPCGFISCLRNSLLCRMMHWHIYAAAVTAPPPQINGWQKKGNFSEERQTKGADLKLSAGVYVAPFKSNDSSKCWRDTRHIESLCTRKHTHTRTHAPRHIHTHTHRIHPLPVIHTCSLSVRSQRGFASWCNLDRCPRTLTCWLDRPGIPPHPPNLRDCFCI